jgi:Flp pilus assembly pilin Flp
MRFLRDTRGQNAVEWLLVVVIVVAVVGGIIVTISESLATKLTEYNDAL